MSSKLVPLPAARRGEATLGATRGLCNTCGRLCDARLVVRDERVWLSKWCPLHGPSEGLVSSDVAWHLNSLAYVKPSTRPRARAVQRFDGCPASCGLCPEHQQHTCVPILEITGRCDMDCPVCLVGGQRNPTPELSPEQVSGVLEALERAEGRLNMLTLSGGEPTLHPQLLEIVDRLRQPSVGILSISTNGLRLASDDALLRALIERDVVIALQMDGFSPATWERLRGQPELAELKPRLIERILELGGRVSLTVTLAPGINEHELPGILDLLFRHDGVVSVMVQPVAFTGQVAAQIGADAHRALTVPDAIAALVAAAPQVLRQTDFSPLPCSHPTCFALTYLLKTTAGAVVPLPRIVDPDAYLDIIKNQALMNTDVDTLLSVRDALYALWSSDGQAPFRDSVLATVRRLMLDLNRLSRSPSHREVLDVGVRNVKSIFIHHFMDRTTFDLSRAMKCCNHYPQADGRLLPVCVRNNVGATGPWSEAPRTPASTEAGRGEEPS